MVRIVTALAVNIITAMTEYIGILWSPVSGVELRATSESSISVEDLEASFFLLVSVIRLPAGVLSSSMVVISTAGGVTEEVADGIGVVVADMEGEGDGVMPGVTVDVAVAGTTVGVMVGVAVAGTTVGVAVGVAVAGTTVGVMVGVVVAGTTVGVTVGVAVAGITVGVAVGATVGVAVAGTVVGVAVGVDVGVIVGVGLGVWISLPL